MGAPVCGAPVCGVALGAAGVAGVPGAGVAGARGGIAVGAADGAGDGVVFDRVGLGAEDLDPELLGVPEEVLVRVESLLLEVVVADLFEPEFGIAAGVLEEGEDAVLGVVSFVSLGAPGNEGAVILGEDGAPP